MGWDRNGTHWTCGQWEDACAAAKTDDPFAEIERLRAELNTTVREREDWNGKHQAACIELEKQYDHNAMLDGEIERLRAMIRRVVPLLAAIAGGQSCLIAAGELYNELKLIAVEQSQEKSK